MVEFAAKYRPDINLDEFERRLRAAAPGPQSGSSSSQASQRQAAEEQDPLAELARLVGGASPSRKEDPFEALFRAQAAVREIHDASAPGQNARSAGREPHFGDRAQPQDFEQQDFRAGQPSWQAGRQNTQDPYAPVAHDDPYADSYGAPPAVAGDSLPYAEAEPQWAEDDAASLDSWSETGGPAPYNPAPVAVAPDRKRKVATIMAFVLIAGVLGIGGTLALRGKSGGEVKTIQANSDPAKIKPDANDAGNGGASQTLFDRKADTAVAKVVSKSEQPADLNAAVKAARSVGPADAVPTPPAPSADFGNPPAEQDNGLPAPKRVKTVSVRADGSVINGADAKPQLGRNMSPMTMGLPPAAAAAPGPATRTPTVGSPDRASFASIAGMFTSIRSTVRLCPTAEGSTRPE